MTLNLVSF